MGRCVGSTLDIDHQEIRRPADLLEGLVVDHTHETANVCVGDHCVEAVFEEAPLSSTGRTSNCDPNFEVTSRAGVPA